MKQKLPRISVSMGIHFKDPPDVYRGLVDENWNIGSDSPLKLHVLVARVAHAIMEFYTHCLPITPDEANESMVLLSKYFSTVVFENEVIDKSMVTEREV
jgi:hypothetical protein